MEAILELLGSQEGVIGEITVLFVVISYFYKDSIKKVIESISFKKAKKDNFKYGIKDLAKHPVFNEIERLKGFRKDFKCFHLLDVSKTKIFNDFLQAKLDSTAQHLHYINEQVNNEMTRAEVRYIVDHNFNACNDNVGCVLKTKFTSKGLSEADANLIIGKFFAIREEAMKRYERRFDAVFASPYYENNFQLLLAVFDNLAWEVEDMKNNCVTAFESVNGMFFELDYAG